MVDINTKVAYVGLQLQNASSDRGDIELIDTLVIDSNITGLLGTTMVPTSLSGKFYASCVLSAAGYGRPPIIGVALVLTKGSAPTWGRYSLGGTDLVSQSLEALLSAADASGEAVIQDLGHSCKIDAAHVRAADSYGVTFHSGRFSYKFPKGIQDFLGGAVSDQITCYMVGYCLADFLPGADNTILLNTVTHFRFKAVREAPALLAKR